MCSILPKVVPMLLSWKLGRDQAPVRSATNARRDGSPGVNLGTYLPNAGPPRTGNRPTLGQRDLYLVLRHDTLWFWRTASGRQPTARSTARAWPERPPRGPSHQQRPAVCPPPRRTLYERARFSDLRARCAAEARLHYAQARSLRMLGTGHARRQGNTTHTDMKTRTRLAAFLVLLAAAGCTTPRANGAGKPSPPAPLVIQEQGSFAVGGSVITNPGTYERSIGARPGRRSTAITRTCSISSRRTRARCRS